jgi:4-amino-4-deoxy-L-arabinose transferase-like glycosyltransferase
VIYGTLTTVIIGLLTLAKETFILFPAIVTAIIFIKYLPRFKRSLKRVLFFALIYILTLLPLLIYNYRTYGKFALSQKMVRIIETLPRDLDSINRGKRAFIERNGTIAYIQNIFWGKNGSSLAQEHLVLCVPSAMTLQN